MNQSTKRQSAIQSKGKRASSQLYSQTGSSNSFGASKIFQCGGRLSNKKGYIQHVNVQPTDVPVIQFATNEDSNYVLQADGKLFSQKIITVKKDLEDQTKQKICEAIDTNDIESLKKLYQYNKTYIDQRQEVIKNTGWTAIQKCCQLGHTNILQFLVNRAISETSSLQELSQVLGLKNKMGKTALMICAWTDYPQCLQIILQSVQKTSLENDYSEKHLEYSEPELFLLNQSDSGGQNAYRISKTGTNSCRPLLEKRDQYYSYHVNLNKRSLDMQYLQYTEFIDPIVEIATGYKHVLALDTKGKVWSWGNNEFGQLGKGDTKEYLKPSKILSLDKEFVCQIYASGNSSFAVTQKGLIQSWGDNQNFMLAVPGLFHEEPKILNYDPWDDYDENLKSIILGKDNFGIYFRDFIYEHIKREKPSNLQEDLTPKINKEKHNSKSKALQAIKEKLNEMEYNYKDLKTRKRTLEKQIQEIQKEIYGDSKNENGQEKIGKDREKQIIEDLDHLIQEIKSEYFEINAQQVSIESDIKYLQNDLDQLKEQLIDIQCKEQTLVNQYADLEEKIRHIQRNETQQPEGNLTKQQQEEIQKQKEHNQRQKINYQRQLKTVREILNANENVKNSVIKKQNQNEDNIQDKKRLVNLNQRKLDELTKKQKIYQILLEEKNTKQKVQFVENNKGQLEKTINKYNTYQKQLQESSYQEISKKAIDEFNGLLQIIENSDEQIAKVKNELNLNKPNSKDPSQDGVNKYIEIIQDNINVRQMQNNATMALILQCSQKYEEMQSQMQDYYNQNSQNKQDDKEGYEKYLSSLKKIVKIEPKIIKSKSMQRQIDQENTQKQIQQQKEKKRGLFCF